jgi:uncharacterized LabA/DUF88 family protein
MNENARVAVFIDAENISAEYAEKILLEAAGYGDVIIKRIFADWSSPQMQSWKAKVPHLSLVAEQQFAAVKGKNASDISLIVSVLTSLFEKNIDVFCLVSSDSDFTRLVQELREREKLVIGFGMQKTAVPAFVNSFSEYVYLDKPEKAETKANSRISPLDALPREKLDALREIIDRLIERSGRALYGLIGIEMKNKFADFIPKNYGCKTMRLFIEKYLPAIGNFRVETDRDGMTMFLVQR